MAGNGGPRPGAGRPLGSKDRLPRGKKPEAIDRLKQIVIEAQEGEYLWKDKLEPFEGNSFDLLRAIYKCNQIDIKLRMYAASKMVEHELPVIVEQNTAEDQENTEWLVRQLDRLEAARKPPPVPIAELTPPEQPPVVMKKHQPVTIDVTAAPHPCDNDAETGGNPDGVDVIAASQSDEFSRRREHRRRLSSSPRRFRISG